MYLLSQYYNGFNLFAYLAENKRITYDLLIKSANMGNYDAINYLLWLFEIENRDEEKKRYTEIFKAIKPLLNKEIKKNNIQAMLSMARIMELEQHSQNEVCKLRITAFHKEVNLATVNALHNCVDIKLDKIHFPDYEELSVAENSILRKKIKDMLTSKTLKIRERKELATQLHNAYDEEFEDIANQFDQEIREFYMKLGQQGNSEAYIALISLDILDHEIVQEWQDLAIKLNNSCELADAGYGYLFGERGREKNVKLGLEYLEKAVQHNNPDAMDTLGDWLLQTSKRPQDRERGFKLLKQAAELNSTHAMIKLALLTEKPENYEWAVKAYTNNVNMTDVYNIEILPLILYAYKNGIGVQKDQKMIDKITADIKFYSQF